MPTEPYTVPFGEAVIRRAGTDVTIIGIGGVLPNVLIAADKLAADGINAEVIDPRTLVPF